MTSVQEAGRRALPHDLVAKLRKLYGGQRAQRDIFGRRAALPSEVARTLAQRGRVLPAAIGSSVDHSLPLSGKR